MTRNLFIKVTRELFPLQKDRFPMIYLEHGRLEVDDGSIKWVSSENDVVTIPVATLCSIAIGPGCSITSEAIKVISSSLTTLIWVSENSLSAISSTISPTHTSNNLMKQIYLVSNPNERLRIAKKIFSARFYGLDISNYSLQQCMGVEGSRVRALYLKLSKKYGVVWQGRNYIPGKINKSDRVNKLLTLFNSYLYGVVTSVIIAMGYSPYIGFIHRGSPLAFTYDIADMYKSETSIDLAFLLSSEAYKNRSFSRTELAETFVSRLLDIRILERLHKDLEYIFNDRVNY